MSDHRDQPADLAELPEPPVGVADDGAEEDDARAGSASTRGWGSAPVPRASIVSVSVGAVTIPVHRDIAPLVKQGLEGMRRVGYEPRAGECWGYAPRRIRPTAGRRPEDMPWSNHAWGLAVDINAPANPMGPRLVTDMPQAAVEAFTDLGFRWGGSYPSRPDAMHFEFMGTADAARAASAKLGGQATTTTTSSSSAGGPSGTSTPGRSIVDVSLPTLRKDDAGPHVKALQALLNAKAGTTLAVDGEFGENTDKAVRDLQGAAGLGVDGVVGPKSWKHLLEHP